MSESGADVTRIDGGGSGRVISITTGVDESTKIDGFTIQNGQVEGIGAGIACELNSSPTIMNNMITENNSLGGYGTGGGGIGCSGSSPMVIDNTIHMNTAYAGGGILCIYNSG